MKRGQDCLISETFDHFDQKQSGNGDDECCKDFLGANCFLLFISTHHKDAKIDKRNCNQTEVRLRKRDHWGMFPKSPTNSAQRVPEPDPIPGISFDTRPDSVLKIIG